MEYQILLPAAFTDQHHQAVEQYIVDSQRLTAAQWRDVLEAFDLLGMARVQVGDKTIAFTSIYRSAIEMPFASEFISRLLQLANPEQAGISLKAAYARMITSRLLASSWYNPDARHSLYLRAYSVFWWDSFAKGYIFEVLVYRDLKASGVVFTAHDITDPRQRRSPFDLVINGWRGDVKTSSYFLITARTAFLHHDFYITRLYDWRQRRRVWAVIMQPRVWQALDGETGTITDLDEAGQRFPEVVHLNFRTHRLIVADYEIWRALVLDYQRKGINS